MKIERIAERRWLVFDEPRLLDWCAARIPHVGTADGWHMERAQAVGVADKRDIMAAMVVHSFSRKHAECQISMAADTARWATRATIARLLAYPFDQLHCQRLTTLIPARNERAIRFNEGIGFKREGLARRGFGIDDCVILGLLEEETPSWARTLARPTGSA